MFSSIKAIPALSACVFLGSLASVQAQSTKPTTEIGLYGFFSSIEGTSGFGDVSTDFDVPFDKILDNLDAGFMAFVHYQNNEWSFIADYFHVELGPSGTATGTIASVDVDVSINQTIGEAFVGYRVHEQGGSGPGMDVDLLGGLRYNQFDFGVDAAATTVGLTGSRSRSEEWVDGVLGVRTEYAYGNGWSAIGWADIGTGDGSSSYQLRADLSYTFANNIRLYGGYRFYHFEYDSGGSDAFTIDADYSGPTIGISYQF